MKEAFEQALADISLAQGKEEIQKIESQIRGILDSDPLKLVEWVKDIERLTPIATESVVDLAGHYLHKTDAEAMLKELLAGYRDHPSGWVRTKAQAFLDPESVSVSGYRHGDRIYRKFLKPGFSINLHDLKEQEDVSLDIAIEEDWMEVYAGSFKYQEMHGEFIYFRSSSPDEATKEVPEGWLGLGRIFEPEHGSGDGLIFDSELMKTDPIKASYELAENWVGTPAEGSWFFHAEGCLLSEMAPDLYVQAPPTSILSRLPKI